MSLLARFEAALVAKHATNVNRGKGATMTSTYACCDHCSMTEDHSEGHERPCSGTCSGSRTMTSKAPSSPVGATEPPARPIPPEALNGLTGAAYTDVIRREADRDYFIASIAARDATITQMADEIKEAWLTIANLQTGLAEALATIARMRTGRP